MQNAKTLSYQRLVDDLFVSQELRSSEGAEFVRCIQDAEAILNCIGILICPDLFTKGTRAINKLKRPEGQHLHEWHDNVQLWPSFFSGIEVISNRTTPSHRDAKAAPPAYDFLVSAGRHRDAWFELPDVQARLSYEPGTVVALCGRVLRHAVPNWGEGERLCIAHFMRDAVHNRLNIPRPDWVSQRQYLELMDGGFVTRQGWHVDI